MSDTTTSPLRNRVAPTGEIVANAERGTLTGNRGILHVADRVMGPALWKHRAWIACTLSWKRRRRIPMSGRKWTELFFLDEAVALAAGHRPCAYCRRADYARWAAAWAGARGRATAPEMDRELHAARARPGARAMRRGRTRDVASLPPGAFVMWRGTPHLVEKDALRPYAPGGYGARTALPRSEATVLTPAPTLDVLRAGYVPQLHPSVA